MACSSRCSFDVFGIVWGIQGREKISPKQSRSSLSCFDRIKTLNNLTSILQQQMSTDNISDQPPLPRADYSSVPSRNMYQQRRSTQQEYSTARGPAHGRPCPSAREAAAASAGHSHATRVVHNSSAKRSYGANAFGEFSETSHRHVQHDHRKASAKQRQPAIGGPALGAHPGVTEAQREALVIWERVKRLVRLVVLYGGCDRFCCGRTVSDMWLYPCLQRRQRHVRGTTQGRTSSRLLTHAPG